MIKNTKQPIKGASCADADSLFYSRNFSAIKEPQGMTLSDGFLRVAK